MLHCYTEFTKGYLVTYIICLLFQVNYFTKLGCKSEASHTLKPLMQSLSILLALLGCLSLLDCFLLRAVALGEKGAYLVGR